LARIVELVLDDQAVAETVPLIGRQFEVEAEITPGRALNRSRMAR
jgi:hypothetical protein